MFMPCKHICCVIESSDFYTEDLFHIRWWKHFEYIFKKGSSSRDEKTRQSLHESLNYIRSNNYCSISGKYKGIPVTGTSLLQKLHNMMDDSNILSDEIQLSMESIYNKMIMNHVFVRGENDFINTSFAHLKKSSVNENNDSTSLDESFNVGSDHDMNDNDDNVNPNNFITGSQTISQLSEYRESSTNTASSSTVLLNESRSYYKQLEPLFNDLVSSIKSQDDFKTAKSCLEKLTFDFLSKNRKRKNIDLNETTFLGEQMYSQGDQKRHKYCFEKF